jgi:CBS domain containing-hemolysin-like protein
MGGADWIVLAVVVVLFVLSIFLAVAETAFVRMSRIRALALEEEGNARAGRLAIMLEQPEQTLNSVLLLVLVSQLTSATLIGVLLEGTAGAWGVVIGIVLQILLFFVIGEVAPKTFAVQHTERAALAVTPMLWFLTQFAPLRLLSRLLIGVANVILPGKGLKEGPFVTEEEIRTMADVAASEEAIEREEQALIHSIFEFGDTVVREVMQPTPDVVTVDCDDTIEDAIETAIEGGFSRMPAREGDDIGGLVYLKDLVRRARAGDGGQTVRTAARPATFVPEQKRVAELLREMQTEHFHMAVVVDEYGSTSGIVTMEDLLEEIVGEIADEYDVERPGVERCDDGSVRLPGRMAIDDASDELGVELPDAEWDTISGLVLNLLGHVPEDGETVRFGDLELTAEDVQERRIGTVHIRNVPDAGPTDAVETNGAAGSVVDAPPS